MLRWFTHEVKSIEIERHSRDTHGGQPDADDGPGSQEEVQGARVVEGSVLEDEAAKVTVGGNNVVTEEHACL